MLIDPTFDDAQLRGIARSSGFDLSDPQQRRELRGQLEALAVQAQRVLALRYPAEGRQPYGAVGAALGLSTEAARQIGVDAIEQLKAARRQARLAHGAPAGPAAVEDRLVLGDRQAHPCAGCSRLIHAGEPFYQVHRPRLCRFHTECYTGPSQTWPPVRSSPSEQPVFGFNAAQVRAVAAVVGYDLAGEARVREFCQLLRLIGDRPRQVLVLRHTGQGLSYGAIGERLGVPAQVVREHERNALRRLKRAAQGSAPPPPPTSPGRRATVVATGRVTSGARGRFYQGGSPGSGKSA